MPDRIIREELLESERWLTLKDNADRLAYVALILRADDYGNFSAEPYRLMRMWREFGITTTELVAKTLNELGDHELIRVYETDGKRFLHLPRFKNSRRYWSRKFPKSPFIEQDRIESNQEVREKPAAELPQPSERGRRGVGELPPRRAKKPAPSADTDLQAACRQTWQAYSDAYEFRHGAAPIRDAKANSSIKSFCKSVPQSEAPDIARFFVQNNQSFYVLKKHPPTILALDAAKLRTEWVTGQQITQTQAMQADKTASRKNVFTKLINEVENGK